MYNNVRKTNWFKLVVEEDQMNYKDFEVETMARLSQNDMNEYFTFSRFEFDLSTLQ